MSQYPPQYDAQPPQPPPVDYGAYGGYAEPPARPTAVTVLSIFAICIGGLFTLCAGLAMISAALQLAGTSFAAGSGAQTMHLSGALQAYTAVGSLIGLGVWIALLAIGIGGLSLKRWALRLAIPWSIFEIGWGVVQLVLQIAWVGPATLEMVKHTQQATPSGPTPAQFAGILGGAMIGMAVVTFIIQCALPVCFLILWRRPHVVAAFERGAQANPAAF